MQIVIPGVPLAQKRHRHWLSRNGKVLIYDPLAREKALIKREIKKVIPQNFELLKDQGIAFHFYMRIPLATPKKKLDIYRSERLYHCSMPDVDNLIKLYLDCLKNVVLEDDRGVSITEAYKVYSPNPRTVITLFERGECRPSGKTLSCESHDSLVCGTPPKMLMDVPTYAECPFPSRHRLSLDTPDPPLLA